jgi:hypothetical protein
MFLIMFGIGILVFFLGFSQGFESAKNDINYISSYVEQSQDFIFICGDYDEPFYSCNNSLQFRNITGLYCDNRLVCQNQLR